MRQIDLLLITPPFTQLNTPYPATAFLKGFLKEHDYQVAQLDLGIETLIHLFSGNCLSDLFAHVRSANTKLSDNARRMLNIEDEYVANIEPVVAFLQGKDNSLAHGICQGILPQGARFDAMPEDMDWLFGTLGIADKAKYIATLFIEDLGDFITECVDPNFGFSRYAEQLSLKASQFSKLEEELKYDSPITDTMCQLLDEAIKQHNPKVVGFSVPFPGNFYAALKSAQYVKQHYPHIPVVLGGGFVNTELRELTEPKLFNYVDYVCLDDGERPLLQLLNLLINKGRRDDLVRTFICEKNDVKYINNSRFPDFEHSEVGTPDYEGLPLDKYISVLEMANPMHRLWSDGRWNKMAIAHGCYWHKCSFCDVTLDYIKRYSKTSASVLCNRIEAIINQTGQRGFHFVDEAAPPQVLRDLAVELLQRKVKITWWTNIRFEKTFSQDLCRLLAQSGCIAMSGGLEVASNRLLTFMEKGVNIEQVARVTSNFEDAGIMIHAYLMYGFPTQTEQETIDALEVVRQLFENGLVQSAFWHRFTMTVHSPVGQNPERYGVKRIDNPKGSFTNNDVRHEDPTGCDHELFGYGLKKALYNYMHEIGFDIELQEWFDFEIPPTTLSPTLIADALHNSRKKEINPNSRVIWLGGSPGMAKAKKGSMKLFFDGKDGSYFIELSQAETTWLKETLEKASLKSDHTLRYEELTESYKEATGNNFKKFSTSKQWKLICKKELLVL